jgi:hypothetical protein
MIEIKKHKNGTPHLLIYWSAVDILELEVGDEVGFNRDGEDLYIYRLAPLGVRFGTGFKITNTNTQTKGLTTYSSNILSYGDSGDVFEVDDEYVFDELNEVELYPLTKVEDGS